SERIRFGAQSECVFLSVRQNSGLWFGGEASELTRRTTMKMCEHGSRASTVGRRDFLKMGAGGGALAMTALGAPAAFADIDTSHTGSIDIHAHWMPEVYANALNQLR